MISLKKLNLFLAIILVGLTASLLYFRVFLNSDTLFLDALSSDLFRHKGHWSDWRLTPAPAYFPDMLLYFLSFNIFSNAVSRIFFVSASQVVLLTMVCVWVSKQIEPKLSKNAITTLVLLVCFTTLVSAKSGMWLYFYSANNHFASLLCSLFSLGLYIRFFEKPSWKIIFLMVLIGGIAQASTLIYLICFVVPGLLYGLSAIFIFSRLSKKYRVSRNRFLSMVIILICSLLFGFFLDKILIYNAPLDGRIPASIAAARNSLYLFLKATKDVFTLDNPTVLVYGITIVFSFLFLLYKLFRSLQLGGNDLPALLRHLDEKRADRKIISIAVFLMLLIPVNLLMVITSGGIMDVFGHRYFLFPIALTLVLTVVLLDRMKIEMSAVWSFFNFAFIIILFVLSIQFIKKTIRLTPPINSVATCISKITDSSFLPQAGIADYWNAREVSHDLVKNNPILATINDGTPFFWMASLGMIRAPLDYPEYYYNFVILRNTIDFNSFSRAFKYTPQTIGRLLPKPSSIYFCNDSDTQIWFYNNGQLDLWVKLLLENNLALFVQKLTSKVLIHASSLPGVVGGTRGTYRMATSTDDKSGFLTYGPYIDLLQGKYKIVVTYSAKDKSTAAGYIELGRFDKPKYNSSFQKKELAATSDGQVIFILDVPSAGLKHLEIRTWFSGHGELVIKSIQIKRFSTR